MKKAIKWLIIGIIIFLLVGGIYVFGKYVVFPSYLSVKYACTNISIEELQEEGYTIVGIYHSAIDEIILYEPDPMVLKHELCHAKQDAEGRLNSCDNLVGLFFNEIECYIVQYF